MKLQPVVMGTVTVHWEAESSTAGWPCTLLRVTQVGKGHRPWDVGGRVRACSGCDAMALSLGGAAGRRGGCTDGSS